MEKAANAGPLRSTALKPFQTTSPARWKFRTVGIHLGEVSEGLVALLENLLLLFPPCASGRLERENTQLKSGRFTSDSELRFYLLNRRSLKFSLENGGAAFQSGGAAQSFI